MTPGLTPERWRQIASIYGAVMELPASGRAALLRARCADDETLRSEVESLLSAGAGSGLLDSSITVRELPPSGIVGSRFRIVRTLGRGGMGVVYEAEDLQLGGFVALKTIRPEIAHAAGFVERFKQEIQAAKKVTHPNACRIYDVGFHPSAGEPDADIFLTMELLEGETLSSRLKRGRMTRAEAETLIRQLADALGAAHKAGVIHRDFKSGNVMLARRDGAVHAVVMDFGLSGSETRAGDFAGTPEYMAPEQLTGGAITFATDVYAFGIVMYEMLTGRRPFRGETPFEAAAKRLYEAPEAPRRFAPDFDPRWERVILRCLQRNPGERIQSAAEVGLALAGPARSMRKRLMMAGAVMAIAITAAAAIERARRPQSPRTAAGQQITDFSDSATDPALSPDGRMLAFKRGGRWFMNPGQIYIKRLPDGQPVAVTHDAFAKMTPVFSPDGGSLAYSVRRPGSADWEIWKASVSSLASSFGEPHLWLGNAEGLTWIDKAHILFSELKDPGAVMSVVTATDGRSGTQDVYVPPSPMWMAHLSALSPDRTKVMIVEMDPEVGGNYAGFRCRLAPFDGSSRGRLVGPPGSCISAAWSPAGKWMYFSARVDARFHLWRQKSDGGPAEQITFGPTEEEGLAIAADGRSAITSVGAYKATVWVRDAKGERQVSGEGQSTAPMFAADGGAVFYLSRPVLWRADLRSGTQERVLPGIAVAQYTLSADAKAIAYVTEDGSLWYAAVDGRTVPVRLAKRGEFPQFTRSGDIIFLISSTRYRIHPDGTGLHPAPGSDPNPILRGSYFSPDENWNIQGIDYGPVSGQRRNGGPALPLCWHCSVHWNLDGRLFWISLREMNGEGITGLMRLNGQSMLPRLPAGGVHNEAGLRTIPGVEIIPAEDISPAPDGSGYAFVKQEAHSNLYRIPLP